LILVQSGPARCSDHRLYYFGNVFQVARIFPLEHCATACRWSTSRFRFTRCLQPSVVPLFLRLFYSIRLGTSRRCPYHRTRCMIYQIPVQSEITETASKKKKKKKPYWKPQKKRPAPNLATAQGAQPEQDDYHFFPNNLYFSTQKQNKGRLRK
jgi:hypothetical protein